MQDSPRPTPLHAAHVELGAKMVEFCGFEMPITFEGILAEHEAVRTDVGIFDVSHMGEVDFRGPDALQAIQRLVTNDASKLGDGRALYTVVCHDDGGIVDDCIVYRFAADHFRIVVNAANIDKDHAHFVRHAGDLCEIENCSDAYALVAVQGPRATALVAKLCGEHLREVPGFGFAPGSCAGIDVVAARTGYTGEDGFELFVSSDGALDVWRALLAENAKPIGLGARDTLRLEARLCLYGNDIDDHTNPYEAGLGWVVKLDKNVPCLGHEALVRIKDEGPLRKLVGFRVTSRGIVRAGAEVLDDDEAVVGRVTSGGPAPTVGGAIGMAYVPTTTAKAGTTLRLRQRGKILQAEQHKGPFYKRKA
jgi:aminomethyltransferase